MMIPKELLDTHDEGYLIRSFYGKLHITTTQSLQALKKIYPSLNDGEMSKYDVIKPDAGIEVAKHLIEGDDGMSELAENMVIDFLVKHRMLELIHRTYLHHFTESTDEKKA